MRRCNPSFAMIGLLASGVAHGHANLVTPAPRAGEDIKVGPCGASPGAVVETFAGLESVEVFFEETVDHPGHYRLALSPEGIDGIPEVILADDIPDMGGAVPIGGRQYSRMVEMPNITCARCTLQLIQVMTNDPANPTYYYSCADVALEATAAPDAGPDVPDAAPSGADSASPQVEQDETVVGSAPGVCAVATGRTRSPWPALPILAILLGFVARSPRIGAKPPGSTPVPR